MRFLLINDHCITDPTAGSTQSLRTIVEWLADEGHACHVLTTARFEANVPFTIREHLASLGVRIPRRRGRAVPVVRYATRGVPISLLLTTHNDESQQDVAEAKQYLALFDELLDTFRPDAIIGCNAHLMIFAAFQRARQRGIATAFAVRGFAYYDERYFDFVDSVFTCSAAVTAACRERIGLVSTPLEPPIDWSTVVSSGESRRFLTFVNPALHKGVLLFARLADMLGSRRPDIPVMIVQSGATAGALNGLSGFDFSRYPQIVASPPASKPADYFGLTRVLLVPSAWDEPFGRVAAEAMINGIPPIVSDRGALSDVVGGDFSAGGGGFVVPLPPWMTGESTAVPSEREVQPWFDRVCALWDDPELYAAVARNATRIATERYSEPVSRKKHLAYFTSLRPGSSPLLERTGSSRVISGPHPSD